MSTKHPHWIRLMACLSPSRLSPFWLSCCLSGTASVLIVLLLGAAAPAAQAQTPTYQQFSTTGNPVSGFAEFSQNTRILSGDFDTDGDVDFFVFDGGNLPTGTNPGGRFLQNDGNGNFTDVRGTSADPFAGIRNDYGGTAVNSPVVFQSDVFVKDFDNDGDLDILHQGWSSGAGSRESRYFENTDGSSYTERITSGNPFSGITQLDDRTDQEVFGDFDSDGDVDLFLTDLTGLPSVGSNTLKGFYYQNDGSGGFTEVRGTAADPFRNIVNTFEQGGTNQVNTPIVFPADAYVADFDNDGDLDILHRDWDNGDDNRYFENTTGSFYEERITTGNPFSAFPVLGTTTRNLITHILPGDFDSDGDVDLFIFDRTDVPSGTTPGGVYLTNDGTGTFTDVRGSTTEDPFAGIVNTFERGNGASGPVNSVVWDEDNAYVDDFNGDGDVDIVHSEWDAAESSTPGSRFFGQQDSPPRLTSSTPASSATGVNPSGDIVLIFDEAVSLGTGAIEIRRVSDDGVEQSITLSSGSVTGGGTATVSTTNSTNDTVTLSPSGSLPGGTALYVHTDAGAIVDSENATTLSLIDRPETLNFETSAGNTAPVFTQTTSSESVAENGTGVVFDFDANDGDGGSADGSVTYTLGGTDAGDFTINASGELAFASAPDFENPADANTDNQYLVDVIANDGAATNNTTTESVTVTVSNVNETPVFTAGGPFSVSETAGVGTTVGDVDATDGDGGATDANVSYAITSGNFDLDTDTTPAFVIDGATGVITVSDADDLDHETVSSASLTIEASDGTFSPTTSVSISITDVNEPPTLTLSTTTPSLAENNTTPTAVATITINDDPAGTNALSVGGTDAGSFQINGSDLEFTAVADFETKSSYTVTVNVDDPAIGATGTIEDSDSFTLSITDVNEAPTAATGSASSIALASATLSGTASTGGGPATTVEFVYFPTATPSSFTRVAADESPVSSASPVSVSADISSLTPNTDYTFRVEATSDEGTVQGSDVTFSTSGAPEINVTADGTLLPDGSGTFDFGTVDGIATDPAQEFVIGNTGSASLNVTSTTLSNTTDFTITQAPSSPVGSNSSTSFIVRFDASVPGPYSTTVTIANNDADENPYTFDIEATAGAPEADVFVETSPSRTALPDGGTFDFGSVTVGQSGSQTFTVVNSGTATLTITGIATSGDTGAFSLGSMPATAIAPGGSSAFDVAFAPSSTGSKTFAVSISTNDADETPYEVTLTGTAATRALVLTDGSASGLNIAVSVTPGTANNLVGALALSAGTTGATLDALTLTSDAPGAAGITAARLFGSDDLAFDPSADPQLGELTVDNTSAPATFSFTGLSDPIPTSPRYLLVAFDVASGAPPTDLQLFVQQPGDLVVTGAAVSEVNGQAQTTFAALPLSNAAATLPVELTRFTADLSGEGARLDWTTATETSNAGFEVQRRIGLDAPWQAVGYVSGAGTTTEAQRYRFVDADLPYATDRIGYRLRQVDVDGAATLSAEQVVTRALAALEMKAPYPNPARHAATVPLAVPAEAGAARLTLYDLLGREVRTWRLETSGRQEHAVTTGSLPTGTYFLRLTAGGQVVTRRLTVVR